ncbi:hypothetical protein, partial [Escherichia coli]|uniref:hypothetical protein n=1 Tax=Escherichia coli TaxID=562 RepID=UPI003F758E22
YGHGACVEQDDKGWDARKRAYCLKIQPATGSFARNLIYSTKPVWGWKILPPIWQHTIYCLCKEWVR